MPSIEKILRFIFRTLFILAPVYFGFIKASLPVFLGLTVLYTFAYVGERKSLWFASLRAATLGRNIVNLALTVMGQVFVIGILGLIGRGASAFIDKDYFFHHSFNTVNVAVLLALFVGGVLSAFRRTSPLPEQAPKLEEAPPCDTLEMIDCESECFSVGSVELSFSPETIITIESGKMQVHIKSAPIAGDPASPFGQFDTSREVTGVGFRFGEIIFPTQSPEIELTHPSPATYIWEEGFKFGLVFFGRISIRKGWFQMRGLLQHGYEAPGAGTPIRVCRKFTPAEVDPSLYQFTSLKKADEAGPDNVFRLVTELNEGESTADVAKFKNLRYLNLTFVSTQDLDTLNRLKNLQELRLASDVPQELPSAIFEMDSLNLWLSLKLKSIPQGISKLQKLEALDLRNNELTAIPDEVAELRKLSRLNLSRNQLTSLPERIGGMVALEKLEIKNNLFTSLPKSLCNIQKVGLEHVLKGLYMDMSFPSKHATSIDPTLFLAETDPELRARVNGLIAQFGLSEYQEALLSEGRLAIQFRTTQKDGGNSLGKTRFGGVPDLPKGFSHPATDGKYWTFLAQINLLDSAKFSPRFSRFL